MTFASYSGVALACLLLIFSGVLLLLLAPVKRPWAEVAARRLIWAGVVSTIGLFCGLLALFLAAHMKEC